MLPCGQLRNAARIPAAAGVWSTIGTVGLPGSGCRCGGESRVARVIPRTAAAARPAAPATAKRTRGRRAICTEGSGNPLCITILCIAMPTYRELLNRVKAEIDEVD